MDPHGDDYERMEDAFRATTRVDRKRYKKLTHNQKERAKCWGKSTGDRDAELARSSPGLLPQVHFLQRRRTAGEDEPTRRRRHGPAHSSGGQGPDPPRALPTARVGGARPLPGPCRQLGSAGPRRSSFQLHE